MEFIDYDQGSDEWHAHRKTHANASEAPAVMNEGQWMPRNPRDLCMLRAGRAEVKQMPWMADGNKYEPEIRAWANEKLGREFVPVVCRRDVNGIPMSASLDGFDFSYPDEILEVKRPRSAKSAYYASETIPPHLLWQVQHQLTVAGARIAHCVIAPPGCEAKVFTYEHDPEAELLLLLGWADVWPHIEAGTIVGAVEDDVWTELATTYRSLKDSEAELSAAKKEIEQLMIGMIDGDTAEGAGVRATKVTRKGSIDYSSLPKEVVKELPRKPDTSSWRFTIVKEQA